MSDDFKWHDPATKDNIVVPSVDAIAVYLNPHGDVVIRQESRMGEDDSIIVVPRSMVENLIGALKSEIA